MIFVFGGFVLSDERALQIFGFGLAVAILVDVTVVRLLLVPATMELLGDRNWWLPRWLDRIIPGSRPDAPVGRGMRRTPDLATPLPDQLPR
jgi:putative drug exporter of the RND superfamily